MMLTGAKLSDPYGRQRCYRANLPGEARSLHQLCQHKLRGRDEIFMNTRREAGFTITANVAVHVARHSLYGANADPSVSPLLVQLFSDLCIQ